MDRSSDQDESRVPVGGDRKPLTAALSGLSIGSLTLTPAFDPAVKDYTANTTNATNTITVTPASSSATVEIEVNGNTHQNGTPATWQADVNTVVIVVADGGETEAYTVTVTKS